MPAKGTYSTLSKLQPIQTKFGQSSMAMEEQQRKYREEELRKQQLEEARQARLTDAFRSDYASIENLVTGISSLDEGIHFGVNAARDSLYEHYKQAQKDPALYNEVGFQTKALNLKNYSKNVKAFTDNYAQYAQTVGKGMQDGTLSQWNEKTLDELNGVFVNKKLALGVDPKTGLPVALTANSEGAVKEIGVQKVIDGTGLNEVVQYFDFEKDTMDKGAKLGKDQKTTSTGFAESQTVQSFDSIEEDVRAMAKGLIGKEGSTTDIAKSIWADKMGREPKDLTETDLKEIEDTYVNGIKLYYDEIYKEEIDERAKIAAERLANDKKKKGNEDEDDYTISLNTDESGAPIVADIPGADGYDGGKGLSYGMKKPVYIGHKGEGIMVDRVYLDNNDQIRFSGKKYKKKVDPNDILATIDLSAVGDGEPKTIEKFEEFTEGITPTEVAKVNDIARALGFKNAKELKDELVAQREENLGKTNQPTEGGELNDL